MKKAKVVITTKSGKEKNVEVWIDDETLRLLDECGDERVKDLYLREEYRAQLIERRETRRHQSLEKSIENGHEIQDDGSNIVEFLETKEEITQLYKVLKILTEKQLYEFVRIFVGSYADLFRLAVKFLLQHLHGKDGGVHEPDIVSVNNERNTVALADAERFAHIGGNCNLTFCHYFGAVNKSSRVLHDFISVAGIVGNILHLYYTQKRGKSQKQKEK